MKAKAYITVLGGTFILISMAIDYSYSNLNTYVISYLRSKGHPKITYADWIYVTITQFLTQSTLMPFTGILERKIGTRLCIIIGGSIYSIRHVSH